MADEETLSFRRAKADEAEYVPSVCVGSPGLGAAGLLEGYRATSYWMAVDMPAKFGAVPVRERVVIERNRITGGGVTAGIDFALHAVAKMYGERVAKMVQLGIGYQPAPPFASGSPETAEPEIVEALLAGSANRIEKRRARAELLASRSPSGTARGRTRLRRWCRVSSPLPSWRPACRSPHPWRCRPSPGAAGVP